MIMVRIMVTQILQIQYILCAMIASKLPVKNILWLRIKTKTIC